MPTDTHIVSTDTHIMSTDTLIMSTDTHLMSTHMVKTGSITSDYHHRTHH
jgi:hypothetical protein